MAAPGYYTIVDLARGGGITICHVIEGEDEVEIMHYSPGFTQDQIFGEPDDWRIIAGPYRLPGEET